MTGEEYKTNLLRSLREKLHIKPEPTYKNENGMTTDDIMQFCRKAVSDVDYCDLRRNRKRIMELMRGEQAVSDLAVFVLDAALKVIDGRLNQISDEEKAVYDAVYGDNI